MTTTLQEYVNQLQPDITGQEIREGRASLGLTPEVMARALGVDVALLAQWESGEVAPEAPGGIKCSLEYFKLSRSLLCEEPFSDVEERIEEAQAMLEASKRRRAEFHAKRERGEFGIPPAEIENQA